MYLLEIDQFDRTHKVGVFPDEATMTAWIEQLPFVRKETHEVDDTLFTQYALVYDDMPTYYEAEWNGYRFPLSKWMIDPSEEAYFNAYALHDFSLTTETPTIVEGTLQVDAYIVANEEADVYIASRERFYQELCRYYEAKGKTVRREGVGSEDGEYVLVDDHFLCHLDPFAVEEREEVNTIDELLKRWSE